MRLLPPVRTSQRKKALRCAATVRSSKLEPEASWDLTHSQKAPVAVSMPSVEDHRRLLRDYADASEELTVRDTRATIVVAVGERA